MLNAWYQKTFASWYQRETARFPLGGVNRCWLGEEGVEVIITEMGASNV